MIFVGAHREAAASTVLNGYVNLMSTIVKAHLMGSVKLKLDRNKHAVIHRR